MKLAVPLLIIISNSVIKHASIILSKWLKFDKRTNEISMIQILCFIMLFFNNALAILFINARFTNFIYFNKTFDGKYSDLDQDWYIEIAPLIVSPMYVQLIFPLQNLIPKFFVQQTLAWVDRRFTNPQLYKTHCTSALQYADLNSGAEHRLFEKYPRIVNIVMVSMMYSFGMPILYVIGIVSISVSYIFEKLIVVFYHRKPPMYDDTLNNLSVQLLKWGAFTYALMSYWMISNRQMFANVITPLEYQNDIEEYMHYAYTPPDYTYQLVVRWIAILIGLCMLVYDLFNMWIKICFLSSSKKELLGKEDLLGKNPAHF